MEENRQDVKVVIMRKSFPIGCGEMDIEDIVSTKAQKITFDVEFVSDDFPVPVFELISWRKETDEEYHNRLASEKQSKKLADWGDLCLLKQRFKSDPEYKQLVEQALKEIE